MATFWEETVQLLQPPGDSQQLITKPQLKPELLQKIPFKFLHDVIAAVLKKTKFAPGMFTKEEMDRKWEGYDKDKVGKDSANQNKRKFLADVLGVVGIALNEPIACDVVKGKDATGANKLLQMLARAAHVLQLDGVEALRVHRSRGDVQVEATALRPESRRAQKPVRVGTDVPTDLGKQVDASNNIATAAADEHTDTNADGSQDGPMGGGENAGNDVATAERCGPQAAVDSNDIIEEVKAPFALVPCTEVSAAGTAANEVRTVSSTHHQLDSAPHTATTPNEVAGPGNKTAGDQPSPCAVVEPSAHGLGQALQRPMTAKKAPPRTVAPAPEAQRGRLGPPNDGSSNTGSRQAVHVYREQMALEDDSIDVVEAAPVAARKDQEVHGMLVSEMVKVMGSAEAAQTGAPKNDESLDGGINLGRSRRTKKRVSGRVDTCAIRDAVESLVQKITPLARSMDYLQEDKENMQKELQIWRSEGQHWGKQLAEEVLRSKAEDDCQQVTQLDLEIEKVHVQIRQLKRQISQNEERLMNVMRLTIGEV